MLWWSSHREKCACENLSEEEIVNVSNVFIEEKKERSEKRDEKLGALTNHHKNYVAVKILTEIKFILV